MQFEWDEVKNKSNQDKHGISFEQAVEIFTSPHINRLDQRFDYGEQRTQSIGMMRSGKLILLVVHTDRENNIRIISARRANKKERDVYFELCPKI